MGKEVLHCTQKLLGKVEENSADSLTTKSIIRLVNHDRFNLYWLFAFILFTVFNFKVSAQTIYKPLAEDTNSIIFPFSFQYNDQLIEQTGVRYATLAASSPYVFDQMMLLYDVYEKVPAAFRLVPEGSNFPVWNFRYWPDEEVFTWAENRDYSIKPVVGYVCNKNFEVIDTFGISNPHEFYVMPNNLGYAYVGSYESGGIMFPTIVWISENHNTNVYWNSGDPIWGLNNYSYAQSTCSYTTLDTIDNTLIDYFHPNSVAAIQVSHDTVILGVYSRNTDSEFEIKAAFNGTKWVVTNAKVLDKRNHLGHQSDDSVWVNTAHDLQYLYRNEDTIVKSLWDNGGCRVKPNTGYKIFVQHDGDSIRTIRKGLYDVLGQSTAMGNGGVMLQNRYASSITEIENALSYGNIGSANFDLSNDNGMPKIGVWDKNNSMVFAIEQDYSFLTYRFYPYFDSQLDFDALRPNMAVTFSSDSSSVTLSIDSSRFSHAMWSDGVTGVFSRNFTYQEFQTKELVGFVTNNPNWFWFSTHRYNNGNNYVGVNDLMAMDSQLKVYPNPIKSGYALNINTRAAATLTDITGRVINTCDDCETILVPEDVAPGLYLLNITNGQTAVVTKVLVH